MSASPVMHGAAVLPRARGTLLGILPIWLARARGRRQLAALDDRLLRDIGLTRADVEAERRKPFWIA